MKYLSAFVCLIALTGFMANSSQARETIESYESEMGKLNAEMTRVGDFTLYDRHGTLFHIGRIFLDFSSVYSVLAEHPEATGECEFMHAEMKETKRGRAVINKLRYFFRFEGSVIYLNSDLPKEEMKVTFDLDLSQEIIHGSIVNNESEEQEEIGTFRMRIRDAKPAVEKK